ncbi:PspC domain-containing protein [Streptomyces sp. NPDC059175]|uniref:PspC domain-containing protein n=1 Tax=Streptomyces sp. NPDC059175 TaxID=3346757 RepID=UPI0036AA3CDE
MTQPTAPPPPGQPPPEQQSTPARLYRSPRHKVVGGVCGGLGRYCDIDPVVFRVAVGVLAVTGGIGLIFYGFAWLLVPQEGKDENEARRLLSGRVEGTSMAAVLMALLGCALFLLMLGNGGMLAFAALLSLAVAGAAVWSLRRSRTAPDGAPVEGATAQAVAEAPPEATAPPAPGGPSWWRDPIIKDGSTGPVATGYLWGPDDVGAEAVAPRTGAAVPRPRGPRRPQGPRSIGGLVFLLALVAGALGTRLSWDGSSLGASLQIGLGCALAVFGLGLALGSFLGRVGAGTVLLSVITAGLLAGASALPEEIGTQWTRTDWRPASVAAVAPHYSLGTGVATLDLSRLELPAGTTVRTGAEVGAGQLKVIVPKEAKVAVSTHAGLGDVRLPGDPADDVDVAPDRKRTVTLAPPAGTAPAGTLALDLRVGLGQVEVTRAAP